MENNRVAEFIKNPKRALFILAMPIVTEMAVETLYNVFDAVFVGRLGAEAIAAVTFSFPLFFLMWAIYSTVEIGAQSKIARLLGAGDKAQAENSAIHALLLSIFLALLLTGAGLLSLKPLLVLFGATGNVLQLSVKYMSIMFYGAILMFPGYWLSSLFIAQGDSKTSMIIQISSFTLNVILDPIFIFGLKLGVAGSAITNQIAFAFSIILGVYFIKKKSYLKINWKNFRYSWQIVREIFSVGIPGSFVVAILSTYVIFINRFLAFFGVYHVAMFGITSRLEALATLPIFGVSTALLTLTGMFYGAKRYDLLKSIINYGIKIIIVIACLPGLIMFLFPYIFYRLFTPDREIISLGIPFIRLDVFTFPLMAVAMVIGRVLQGMGKGLPAFIINLVRVFIFAVPLAYIFVFVFGYSYLSIAAAMIIGGVASNIIAFAWLSRAFKQLPASL